MNNLGMVVGGAFMYDWSTDTLYRLNQLPSLTAQLDPGVTFHSAYGINDRGDIVGGVRDTLTDERKAFVIDTSPDDTLGFDPDPTVWTVALLPDFNGGVGLNYQQYAQHINENGDVLVTYLVNGVKYAYLHNPWLPDIPGQNPLPLVPQLKSIVQTTALNNLGQVAGVREDGTAFFFDPATSTYSYFADAPYESVGGVNDTGVFCGSYSTRRFSDDAFRYDTQLEPIIEGWATDINADGDVLIENRRKIGDPPSIFLLYTGSPDFPEQLVNVDDLVIDGAAAFWIDNRHYARSISERGPTGFSQIAGIIRDSAGVDYGAILTPFIPAGN